MFFYKERTNKTYNQRGKIMEKMPEAIEFIADKILEDKVLQKELTKLLQKAVQELYTSSLSHNNFCCTLKTPGHITKILLKKFGISDKQLLDAFQSIGFHPKHKMYSDLYYQTLILLYYVGIRADDDVLRMFSIVLIYVKVFNGRKYKYFPQGCIEDIATHVITTKVRSSSIFKKYPNPFVAISQYFAPTLDDKYKSYVKKDAAHPVNGLIKILSSSWNRMDQTFMGLQGHYYKVWNDSDKKIVNLQSLEGGEEVEVLDIPKIEKIINKSMHDLIHKHNKFSPEDIKFLKGSPYMISDMFLKKVQEFLNSGEDDDDIKNALEVILKLLKLQDNGTICNMHIVHSAGKLTGNKSKDNEIEKLKKHIDGLLDLMFPSLRTKASTSSILKLRKIMILVLLLRLKRSICNNAKFEI